MRLNVAQFQGVWNCVLVVWYYSLLTQHLHGATLAPAPRIRHLLQGPRPLRTAKVRFNVSAGRCAAKSSDFMGADSQISTSDKSPPNFDLFVSQAVPRVQTHYSTFEVVFSARGRVEAVWSANQVSIT